MVRTIATMRTGYQRTAFLFSLSWCLMINNILIQKAIAGPAIRNVDKNKEATSGPKINLPPKKNLCQFKTRRDKRHISAWHEILLHEKPCDEQRIRVCNNQPNCFLHARKTFTNTPHTHMYLYVYWYTCTHTHTHITNTHKEMHILVPLINTTHRFLWETFKNQKQDFGFKWYELQLASKQLKSQNLNTNKIQIIKWCMLNQSKNWKQNYY